MSITQHPETYRESTPADGSTAFALDAPTSGAHQHDAHNKYRHPSG